MDGQAEKRWRKNERLLGADRFGGVKERKGQMTHWWDEQKLYCHGTFVLNILKDTLLTPIPRLTVAVKQICDYYRKTWVWNVTSSQRSTEGLKKVHFGSNFHGCFHQ